MNKEGDGMKFWDDEVDNGIDSMFDWDRDGEHDRVQKQFLKELYKQRGCMELSSLVNNFYGMNEKTLQRSFKDKSFLQNLKEQCFSQRNLRVRRICKRIL